MRSALQTPAPSSTLLKFLKSQSEAICLQSQPSTGLHIRPCSTPGTHSSRSRDKTIPSDPSIRCLSTTISCRATVEAGFLNLDFLFPSSAKTLLQPPQCRCTPRIKKPSYENLLPARRKLLLQGGSFGHRRYWGADGRKAPSLYSQMTSQILLTPEKTAATPCLVLDEQIAAKAAAQPILRCTELDENGNVVLASGEFKKSELIAKVPHIRTLQTAIPY